MTIEYPKLERVELTPGDAVRGPSPLASIVDSIYWECRCCGCDRHDRCIFADGTRCQIVFDGICTACVSGATTY